MPIIKSAKKRVRVAKKAAARNVRTKRAMRSALKSLQVSLAANDKKNLSKQLRDAQSALDSAVKKGVIHRNKAARKKSDLAAKVKAAGAKMEKVAGKTPAKKPTAKKAAPSKKVTAKKPAAKAPAKKPVAKKKPAKKK